MKKFLFPVVAFIGSIILGFSGTWLFYKVKASKEKTTVVVPDCGQEMVTDGNPDVSADSLHIVVDSSSFPVISKAVAALSVGETEYHYTICIQASIPDGSPVVYSLRMPDGSVMGSRDGYFYNIHPGTYTVMATNANINAMETTREILCATRTPIVKLSAQELTQIYNNDAYNENKEKLAVKMVSNPVITYNGMDTSSEINTMPKTHQQLCQKIRMGTWKSITVTNIKYNCLGVATAININYVKAED